MAGMTTVLTEFSSQGNSRTSTYSGHTASKPKLVIEKRRVPEGQQSVVEYSAKVVCGAVDSDGTATAQKVSFEAIVRYPLNAIAADVTDPLAIFRDLIAGDEFGNSVTTQQWL